MFKKLIEKIELPEVEKHLGGGHYWRKFNLAFKQSSSKILRLNAQTLMFFIPVAVLIVLSFMAEQTLAQKLPYSANVGLGFFFVEDIYSQTAMNKLFNDLWTGLLYAPLMAIGSLGAAGVCGVYKRLMLGEDDVDIVKHFYSGIKKNFLRYILCFIIATLAMVLVVFNYNMIGVYGADFMSVTSFILSLIFGILFLAFIIIFCAQDKEVSFKTRIKNSFILTLVAAHKNIFFISLAFVPFALILFVKSVLILGIVFYILVGFCWSACLICAYTEYLYNKYGKVKRATNIGNLKKKKK